MSEPRDFHSLRRIVLGHLESLQAGGVQWLPKTDALAVPIHRAAAPVAESPIDHPQDLVAAPSPLSTEHRRAELQILAKEVSGCMRCAELCSTRTQTVFGSGGPGVELCFVGEAPGADEDAQGFPFVGAAGQLLTRIINGALGMTREEVYICNALKCRPPGNRTPLPNELGNCREYLVKQLELVRPKFLCCLGGAAATTVLQTTLSLSKLRGRFHDFMGIPTMVTYHPSYLLPHRNPETKKDVWEDMKMLLAKMGRPIPQKGTGAG